MDKPPDGIRDDESLVPGARDGMLVFRHANHWRTSIWWMWRHYAGCSSSRQA